MISYKKERLNKLKESYILKNPMSMYVVKEQQFDNLFERLRHSTINLVNIKSKKLLEVKSSYILKSPYKLLDNKANKYLNLVSKLETLSPLLTLQRGYTMTKVNGKVISSSKNIKKGDSIEVTFKDGKVDAEVK